MLFWTLYIKTEKYTYSLAWYKMMMFCGYITQKKKKSANMASYTGFPSVAWVHVSLVIATGRV